MLKKFKIFEGKLGLEPAVLELKEDLLKVFEKQFHTFRSARASIDKLFEELQDEFDKGEQPKPYLLYKESGTEVIFSSKKSGDIRGHMYGIYESYGQIHAEVLGAIETEEFGFLHDKSYKSKVLTYEEIAEKVEGLKRQITQWETIK